MPNVKLFVNETHFATAREPLRQALPAMREMLCARLQVDPAACQLAVIEASGPEDQPPVNAELMLLPATARTPETLRATGAELRAMVEKAAGLHAAVRFITLDPATYIAMK
ncbi:hypothetical protein GI374_07965 [Paracoccus sp. S-4012]|uniref:hypothetical protein n=1 Tax=Paracoccus sp. S-4012 TaxID=2665648 RepID=UPI0012AFEB25|nr:hypothetical protein [Paracoccus sp. S-4012]MRX50382.1 hypothetical protein [Paracoccus sp. S-4012]